MKILFLDGTAGFTPRRLSEKPCGGIATSLTIIPRFLATRHEVYVASAWETEETVEGVKYTRNVQSLAPDIVVFNRNVLNRGLIEMFPKAKKVWWLHDIVDPRYLEDDAFKQVDAIVALSQYCKDSYRDFYGIQHDKFMIIQNGVGEPFTEGDYKDRDKNLYVCATAPIKGLAPLDYIYQNMKRHNPNFRLQLYCSQSLHDMEDSVAVREFLAALKEKGIEVLDPVPQAQLAEVFRKAWCLIMPNSYPEICSNLLLQARACGLPVVASGIGSIPEFNARELTTHLKPHDMFWWWKELMEKCFHAYQYPALHNKISREGVAQTVSWDTICSTWNKLLEELREPIYITNTLPKQTSAA